MLIIIYIIIKLLLQTNSGNLMLIDNRKYKVKAATDSFDMNSEVLSFIDDNLKYKVFINQSLK